MTTFITITTNSPKIDHNFQIPPVSEWPDVHIPQSPPITVINDDPFMIIMFMYQTTTDYGNAFVFKTFP